MNINQNKENTKLIVFADGELDTLTAPIFKDSIEKNLEGIEELILNFKQIRYTSSAGLRVLLFLHKTMHNRGGSMTIKELSPEVFETIKIVGFDGILNIEV
mgnify:CR=1 FL=1